MIVYIFIHHSVLIADRAKQIKTKSSVNEDPTEKLIRELQEENERLKKAIESGNLTIIKGDDEDDDDMSEEGENDILKYCVIKGKTIMANFMFRIMKYMNFDKVSIIEKENCENIRENYKKKCEDNYKN